MDGVERDPLVGRVIGDAYFLLELVGVGGMGRVYRAVQRALSRTVAVKVIHRDLLGDPESIERFYTEARAASSLNHPNSVSIFDFGRTEDGLLYLVMEHLKGKDLAALMRDEGPLPLPRVIELGSGVLMALTEAHARGVVHCDLKPENILVERLRGGGDLVKVVDFGLAKILGSEADGGAPDALVSGTPDYMSPEQARGMPVDGRGDLYSVGVLLFELLAGRTPFGGGEPIEIMTRHVTETAPDPAEIAPYRGIPEALSSVVARALHKDPTARYQDAADLAWALRAAAGVLRQTGPDQIRCRSCGAYSEITRSYCGECGAPLNTGTGPLVDGDAPRAPLPGERPMFGRLAEFETLLEQRRQACGEPRLVCVSGPAGVGKSRLVKELAVQVDREGDVVVEVEAHASGAAVAYEPILACIAQLLNVGRERIEELGDDPQLFPDELLRAGIRELFAPRGLRGFGHRDRTGAVVMVMVRAVELAASRAEMGRVVLFFDDAERYDGLSRKVIAGLTHSALHFSLLTVVVSRTGGALPGVTPSAELRLDGLTWEHARRMLGPGSLASPGDEEAYLPLHIEQLQRLERDELSLELTQYSLPDAFAARLGDLDVNARRLLQVVAVLGRSCCAESVCALAGDDDFKALGRLEQLGLVRCADDQVSLVHWLLRDLVHVSVPAQSRHELHGRALEQVIHGGEALAVRAEHAHRSGEVDTALVLLERLGHGAVLRGDSVVAVQAFRRGLALARRELARTGEVALDTAIAGFSRGLAKGLLSEGDSGGAAGVLHEALDSTEPGSLDRAQMLLAQSEVALSRDRLPEAERTLKGALELASEHGRTPLVVACLVQRAQLHRRTGKSADAVRGLADAMVLLENNEQDSIERIRVALELSELLLDQGQTAQAITYLVRGRQIATEVGNHELRAMVVGIIASVSEITGDSCEARTLYQEAASLAATAGDRAQVERWRRAVRELG